MTRNSFVVTSIPIVILVSLTAIAGCGKPAGNQGGTALNNPPPPPPPPAKSGDARNGETAPPKKEEKAVKAEVGVGKKGRGYGGGMITEPIRVRFRVEQFAVFDVQLPKAMQLFEAEKGRKPKSNEEFMREIVEANSIVLPELPEGESYFYDPEKGELMVNRPE